MTSGVRSCRIGATAGISADATLASEPVEGVPSGFPEGVRPSAIAGPHRSRDSAIPGAGSLTEAMGNVGDGLFSHFGPPRGERVFLASSRVEQEPSSKKNSDKGDEACTSAVESARSTFPWRQF